MRRGYLLYWSWLMVYLNGNYCAIEIDVRLFGVTYTHQFLTRRGFYNYFSNKTKVYKVDNNSPTGNNVNTYI